jgi:hypothetical protein
MQGYFYSAVQGVNGLQANKLNMLISDKLSGFFAVFA